MLPSWLHTLNGVLSLTVVLGLLAVFQLTSLRRSRMLTIIATPLASIIGSGFLVVAPLLYQNFGRYHILAIIIINLFALAVGWVIRTNILYFEPLLKNGNRHSRLLLRIERIARIVLGYSFIIAIAFYLTLLSSFTLQVLNARTFLNNRLMTTAILMFIGVYGYLKGLHGMENLEKLAVKINISIIVGLIVALSLSSGYLRVNGGGVSYLDNPSIDVGDLLILGGMLLIVQGFETARYLGQDYLPRERARGMLIAQLIASAIYILFVPLAAPLALDLAHAPDETAIITIVGRAAFGLAPALSIAAVFSQFGASVADTIGIGGIIEEETRKRVPRRLGYVLVTLLAGILIWSRGVFSVLTLASRSFALYYGLQAMIATILVVVTPEMQLRKVKLLVFPLLVPVLFLIAIFAISVHS